MGKPDIVAWPLSTIGGWCTGISEKAIEYLGEGVLDWPFVVAPPNMDARGDGSAAPVLGGCAWQALESHAPVNKSLESAQLTDGALSLEMVTGFGKP